MVEEKKPNIIDNKIWMKHFYRYAWAMVVGVVILIYIFSHSHEGTSKLEMITILFSGVLVFGGGFGMAVSLFFHLWHRK